ncbi:hypothetical protein GRI89_17665 [Altererythrobacter salegens]|uniref:Outer membrane protein beta-barrel domain-containing protein n=1 Tax=Croceibacterium salegens TaxID=1737568 RepID=A0A6I4SZT2_9SPHN|nr:hypothetical protein [Croceibacterium salegens]MXO61373.1 hypothetical protein [Croceibacterium salegens]
MHFATSLAVSLTTFCLVLAAPASAQSDKAAEDPTKIATKVGVSYADELSVSGSVAVGPKLKFNARISQSGAWSAGASYLLPVAILTFAAGRTEFDSGITQTRYSLGGFMPLSQFGLKTGKLQVFVPFGYTYTSGKQTQTDTDYEDSADGVPVSINSNSAYVGLSMMRPLTDRITLTGGGNVTKGTNDYSGYSLAVGASYHLTKRDTARLTVSHVDNSFGSKQKIGIAYQHEF